MMETINEFGVVDYFNIRTLTSLIFSAWIEGNNREGAAQISFSLIILVAFIILFERFYRGRGSHNSRDNALHEITRPRLGGWHAFVAFSVCSTIVFIGFFLPAGLIVWHALSVETFFDVRFISAIKNSFVVGTLVSFILIILAILVVYSMHLSQKPIPHKLVIMANSGYAVPGAVLATGLLIPLSFVDHRLADFTESTLNIDIGLIFTGSAIIVIFALCCRFFAIASTVVEAAFKRINKNTYDAARVLGKSDLVILFKIYLPLIRPSLLTVAILIFVNCLKELPATLLLRPFGFETLATLTYQYATLEQISDASKVSFLIVLSGLFAVAVIAVRQFKVKTEAAKPPIQH